MRRLLLGALRAVLFCSCFPDWQESVELTANLSTYLISGGQYGEAKSTLQQYLVRT